MIRQDSTVSRGSRIVLSPIPKEFSLLFANETEFRYFDGWQALAPLFDGGLSNGDFWQRTIPQLSSEHASIRHALMAITAIRSAATPHLEPLTPDQLRARGPQYGRAITFYNKAIRELRSAKMSETNLRAAIVCCILFIAFESLHGDGYAALAHLTYAQRMMDQLIWLAKEGKAPGLGNEMLEQETLQIFQRLILQSWSCGLIRPRRSLEDESSSWCCTGGNQKKWMVDRIPDAFDTIQEAQRWWEITQHYVIHQSNIVVHVRNMKMDPGESDEVMRRLGSHLGKLEISSPAHEEKFLARQRQRSSGCDGAKQESSEQKREKQHFLDVLERWYDRFRPLYEAACSQQGEYDQEHHPDYLKALVLRAQYLAIWTEVTAPISSTYETIASMTPYFREILVLTKIILSHQLTAAETPGQETPELFTMSTSPMWPLLTVACRCRDGELRRLAGRMILEHPRRDSLWDSRILGAAALHNEATERGYEEDGLSPAEQWFRLSQNYSLLTEDGRLMHMRMKRDKVTSEWRCVAEDVIPYIIEAQIKVRKILEERAARGLVSGTPHLTVSRVHDTG